MKTNNKKQQETTDCLKKEMISFKESVNSKQQQETIDCLIEEIINLKEQTKINNSTINNEISINNEEALDEELLMISDIWEDSTMNNKNYLIRDIMD